MTEEVSLQRGAHDTGFDSEEDLAATFQAAATTADEELDPVTTEAIDQAVLREIENVLRVVSGPGMDSQKTESLSTLLRSVDPRIAECFVGDGEWNSISSRFDGAPRWHLVTTKLERLRDETLSQNMRVELDLDEMLIDAFSRGTDGYMTFSDFQMMLAEADKEG